MASIDPVVARSGAPKIVVPTFASDVYELEALREIVGVLDAT
jgi:hypothetical protein